MSACTYIKGVCMAGMRRSERLSGRFMGEHDMNKLGQSDGSTLRAGMHS